MADPSLASDPSRPHRVDAGAERFIDLMRGVAALAVMMTHIIDLVITDFYGWTFAENPPGWRWLRAIGGTGENWVWLFFLISGFCIQLSLRRDLESGRPRWWRYAVARVTRIYPIYLLTLALALAVWKWVPNIPGVTDAWPGRQLAASLLSLQIFTGPVPVMEVSWSLSCEMLYYGMWPVLLVLCGLRVRAAAWLGILGSLAVAGGLYLAWTRWGILRERAFADGLWTVSILCGLWLAGVLLAEHWHRVIPWVGKMAWWLGWGIFATGSALLFVGRFESTPPWELHLTAWVALPGMVLMLAGARHAGLGAAGLRMQAVCRWLGVISYPCYLLHFPLLLLVRHGVLPRLPSGLRETEAGQALVYVLAMGLMLVALAAPLETAVMGWRRRLLRRLD
ncbi:MAG: acyltransferase [Verrucomicrobiales bacterium]|nr:acyltransferase [Verrucomicrobiales bacterium]